MSVEQLFIALASAGAVAALILIAWGLGFRTRAKLADESALRTVVAEADPDAEILHALMSEEAGLALLADGRAALVRAMGDRFAVRFARAADLRWERAGEALIVRMDDMGFPPLNMPLPAPPPWLDAYIKAQKV
ncbi:MAG: hypothetical protein AB7O04_02715 [Hyphomonadaceae bacterium]